MSYRIAGLPRAAFAQYFGKTAEELGELGARRIVANAVDGFPCRVTLGDARAGERLMLVSSTHHDVAGPCRSAYAIYVQETEGDAVPGVAALRPVFAGRTLSLRAFNDAGMLHAAVRAGREDHDLSIRALFADPAVACIHAHNAAYGGFAAQVQRHGDER